MENFIALNEKNPNESIFNLIVKQEEVTWQSIIYDLVNSERMNVWDIDITLLTKRYIETIKKLEKMDFRISGKMLLAAALLLKLKSVKLVTTDIDNLDRFFVEDNDEDELFFEEDIEGVEQEKIPKLMPKTPQPRKRKLSVYDLVKALEKALEVKERKIRRIIPPKEIEIPKKSLNIGEAIKIVYQKIKNFFSSRPKAKLTFTNLVKSEKKQDKVYTFIPLLHLSNQRKVEMFQYKPFGEIEIALKTKQEIEKELGE